MTKNVTAPVEKELIEFYILLLALVRSIIDSLKEWELLISTFCIQFKQEVLLLSGRIFYYPRVELQITTTHIKKIRFCRECYRFELIVIVVLNSISSTKIHTFFHFLLRIFCVQVHHVRRFVVS